MRLSGTFGTYFAENHLCDLFVGTYCIHVNADISLHTYHFQDCWEWSLAKFQLHIWPVNFVFVVARWDL